MKYAPRLEIKNQRDDLRQDCCKCAKCHLDKCEALQACFSMSQCEETNRVLCVHINYDWN